MQASFSFFGSEVPGIVSTVVNKTLELLNSSQAAGEVIDATRVNFNHAFFPNVY